MNRRGFLKGLATAVASITVLRQWPETTTEVLPAPKNATRTLTRLEINGELVYSDQWPDHKKRRVFELPIGTVIVRGL